VTAIERYRALGMADAAVTGGFWAGRLGTNRDRTLPHAFGQLVETGTLENFRLAAGTAAGAYRAMGIMFSEPFPFLDSDVYKWLEGAGWELGRAWDDGIARMADEAIDAVAKAQREDGYLNTFVQVLAPGREFRDLQFGHELYCFGHLIQAAVAWHRALGDDRLLRIARRAADAVDRALGPHGAPGIDGHPEIELALVDLYRDTGEARYLELARLHIERRGHGTLGRGRFGSTYWQDHLPVREAPDVTGHAVRQLYLDAGAVDVAVETGDRELLDAVHRRWRDMVATRTYLTGGVGSRTETEAFGDPHELPPDRAYTETCAAIASTMVARRLLLATGDPDAADAIERAMLNGVLAGVSADGTSFFYVNPLQRRTHRVAADPNAGERKAWYACACCPPNVVRTLASWPQHLATSDDAGVHLWQYAAGEIRAPVPGGEVRLHVATDYPWNGLVTVTVGEAPAAEWALSVRVPGWASGASIAWPGEAPAGVAAGERSAARPRSWQAGDTVTLELPMPARVTTPHPRVDAVRGTVALERGPLVYCVESLDLPDGVELEQVRLPAGASAEGEARPDQGDGVIGLGAAAATDHGRTIELHPVP
jgi:DUF1680 family protein